MGGLSRKRTIPRIVKKRKPKSNKNINANRLDPLIREQWDQSKTLKQNFSDLGLALNLKPSMKHSMEGKALRDGIYEQGNERKQKNADKQVRKAQLEIMQNREGAEGNQIQSADLDGENEDENEALTSVYKPHIMKRDYNELFKGKFMYEKDIVRGPSVAKLRGDDVTIMKDLVAKYDDNISSMVRDIKTNYMQWSKSELSKKYKAYYAHNHDKQ